MARVGANWRRMMNHLAELSRVPSRITRPIATRFTKELKTQFKQGADSYGTPWIPLKPSTVKEKGGSTLIMIDTRKTMRETRAVALPGAGIGFVSTDYAGYHMDKVTSPNPRPARPIFPHRKELPERWRKIIQDEWRKAFKSTMEGR